MPTYAFVSEQSVRDYLALNVDSTSRYTDSTLGSNIRAASEFLERATNRYFADRPSMTYTLTSHGAAQVPLPGLRNVSSVTLAGSALVVDESYWLIPDVMQTGVYTGLQFRAFGTRDDGPAFLRYSDWFDRNLDSPKWPGNWGGDGGSLPNDLVIVADGGYSAATLPEAVRHATKVLAAYYTLRPTALLSGAQQSPDGTTFDLSDLPVEVREFVNRWRLNDRRVVTVG